MRLKLLFESVRNLLKSDPFIRNLGRFYRSYKFGDLGWKSVINNKPSVWFKYINQTKTKKVLVATSFGGELTMPILESLISASLSIRNADVQILLCDGLSACQLCDTTRFKSTSSFINNGPSKFGCKNCFSTGNRIYSGLNLKVHKFSDYLTREDIAISNEISERIGSDEISSFKFRGVSVGEHAIAGTCRYFAMADFKNEPNSHEVLRRYLSSSIRVAIATEKLMNIENFDSAFFNHGIYVPQGIIGEVARMKNVKVVNWNTAYRNQCFIFSHFDTYHHTMISEDVACWENIDLSPRIRKKITDYISSRAKGTNDWIKFNSASNINRDDILDQLNLDKSKPVIGLLTNVAWDAQLHYPANAFPNMIDWIIKTIKYFQNREDIQLLIRIHPAELTGHLKSRQLVIDEINNAFESIPSNVFIIPSTNTMNTYNAMEICDSVIIYGTKMGVELTSMGIPVIVAGEAWIRNKGLTVDITSQDHYLKTLDSLPKLKRLDKETQDRALKYAFHFFFRRMIPIELILPRNGRPSFMFELNSIEELLPGKNPGLDLVCDGILKGTPFIFNGED